jgi:hypothetical protein
MEKYRNTKDVNYSEGSNLIVITLIWIVVII